MSLQPTNTGTYTRRTLPPAVDLPPHPCYTGPMDKYTNKKYGKITLRGYARPGGKGIGSYYWGECSCGNRKQFLARMVASGKIRSCGECIEYQRLAAAEQRKKNANRAQMAKATDRAYKIGAVWTLTPREYYAVIAQHCVLCNSQERIEAERWDPAAGFTPANVYAECTRCRVGRGNRTILEYVSFCVSVADRFRNVVDSPT